MSHGKRSRRNMDKRCPKCQIHLASCFCERIPSLNTKTKISFIMHIGELKLPSNTVNLANHCLKNAEIHLRGAKENPLDLDQVLDDRYTPLYLYPTEDAIPLDKKFLNSIKGPIQLIIPDGSWSQAKKIKRRESRLNSIQAVTLPFQIESQYKLRRSPTKGHLSTFEACAYALDLIEKDSSPLKELLDVFNHMVEKFLNSRFYDITK